MEIYNETSLLRKLLTRQPYLAPLYNMELIEAGENCSNYYKLKYKELARELNTHWKKNDRFKPRTIRNGQFFCEKDERQKVVSMKVTGKCFITVLGPRTRSDLAVYSIKVT